MNAHIDHPLVHSIRAENKNLASRHMEALEPYNFKESYKFY